jgi:hypothetical protein
MKMKTKTYLFLFYSFLSSSLFIPNLKTHYIGNYTPKGWWWGLHPITPRGIPPIMPSAIITIYYVSYEGQG